MGSWQGTFRWRLEWPGTRPTELPDCQETRLIVTLIFAVEDAARSGAHGTTATFIDAAALPADRFQIDLCTSSQHLPSMNCRRAVLQEVKLVHAKGSMVSEDCSADRGTTEDGATIGSGTCPLLRPWHTPP